MSQFFFREEDIQHEIFEHKLDISFLSRYQGIASFSRSPEVDEMSSTQPGGCVQEVSHVIFLIDPVDFNQAILDGTIKLCDLEFFSPLSSIVRIIEPFFRHWCSYIMACFSTTNSTKQLHESSLQ